MYNMSRHPKWNIWAKVVGPKLPTGIINVGNIKIGPIQDPDYAQRIPQPHVNPNEDQLYLRVRTSSAEIKSDCWVLIKDVEAPDPDSAYADAEREYVPLVVASLSATVGSHPYHVEVLEIQGTNANQERFHYSDEVVLAPYDRVPLDREVLALALGRWRHLYEDEGHLRNAAFALARGIRTLAMSPAREGTSASLLAYFQVIEACSNLVRWEAPPELSVSQEAVLKSLQQVMTTNRPIARKASAVHQASVDLKRLTNSFLDLRIQNAAERFGLDSNWLSDVREFKKTRDQVLSHAQRSINQQELNRWAYPAEGRRSAYELARTMLTAATKYETEPRPA
jgi:hypothetical protein